MTKKDYELVARILHDELDTAVGNHEANGSRAIAETIKSFADSFERDNPRFDRDRFMRACWGIGNSSIDEAYILLGHSRKV